MENKICPHGWCDVPGNFDYCSAKRTHWLVGKKTELVWHHYAAPYPKWRNRLYFRRLDWGWVVKCGRLSFVRDQ